MADPTLVLVGRSSSHYTRVARIFADELGVPLTLRSVLDLRSDDPAAYGGHPALKIPTLLAGARSLWGTENVCRRLVEIAGRVRDPRIVLSDGLSTDEQRNAQELIWVAMTTQVQLVLGARRAGAHDGARADEGAHAAKLRASMRGALAWLDTHLASVRAALPRERALSLLEVTLFCLLDHLAFRPTIAREDLPSLRAFADAFSVREAARRTPYFMDNGAVAPAPTTREPSSDAGEGRARRDDMPLNRPALDPSTVAPRTGSTYPEVFRARVLPREKRALGDALGLTKIGVNLTTLAPGKESSIRHHHTHEDELIYVLEGEVVLRTNEGEQILSAGMCAGFRAGDGNGHQLVNRSGAPARYLEISNRDPADTAAYPDDDLAYEKTERGPLFKHKDGTPY